MTRSVAIEFVFIGHLVSYLVRAEPSLEKIRPRAALVRELDREKGAKLLRYRKAVARLGVENVDDVLRIVVEGTEGELSVSKETSSSVFWRTRLLSFVIVPTPIRAHPGL
jgi:hypothetical protein